MSIIFSPLVFQLQQSNILFEIFAFAILLILGLTAGRFRKLSVSEKIHSSMLAKEHGALLREIEGREKAEALLRKCSEFDHVIYIISNKFINVLPENMNEVFNSSLQIAGEFLGMDRAIYYKFDQDSDEIENQYEWRSDRVEITPIGNMKLEPAIWDSFRKWLQEFNLIILPDIEMIPEEKSPVKRFLRTRNIKSAIVVPVISMNTLIGFLVFDSAGRKEFSNDIQEKLKIISAIFSNAIIQKHKTGVIHESEERFRLLLQHSSDTIAILDYDGYISYISPASKTLTSEDPEKWLGRLSYSYLHPDDAVKLKGLVQKYVENPDFPPVKVSLRLPSEGGNDVYLETILNGQVNNPAIKGIVCNTRDMSQHFALQEELRNSRNFLKAIIDCASDPMFVKDRDHKYILVNDAFCRLTGRNREDMLGKTAHELFEKEEADFFFSKNEEAFQEETVKDYENTFTDASENKHVMATHIGVYKEESGKKFLIGNLREETKRKEMERDVKKALMKEKELSEMKSKFISMVSHEYRTPLTTIFSSAEILELFGDGMTDIEKAEHLEGIKKTVQYMTSMLDEVLLISKVKNQLMNYSPSSFELTAFCKELLQRLSICTECIIEMNSDLAPRTVFMDEKLIGHILNNLISNAIKYSPKGGVVRLNIKEGNGYINFEIIDQGIGIPEEAHEKLFDYFFRANNVNDISGTGLGLPIVKYCTELHKGNISFESKPGKGTKFMVSLPDGGAR